MSTWDIYPISFNDQVYIKFIITNFVLSASDRARFEFLCPFYDNWGLMDFSVAYSAHTLGSNPGESVLPKDITESGRLHRGSNQGPLGPKAGALNHSAIRAPSIVPEAFRYIQNHEIHPWFLISVHVGIK